MVKRFFPFDDGAAPSGDMTAPELNALLGGKGAGLATMTALGLPVPPGFTIPTTECMAYLEGNGLDLTGVVAEGVAGIERAVGRRLGDRSAPLLLSVRSGAAVSMPGMMDTVLNVGMSAEVARAMAALTGDQRFAWNTFRRAVTSFAQVVRGADADELATLSARADEPGEAGALAFAAAVDEAGWTIPTDPQRQVVAAVEAVFRSWRSDRARTYRELEGIDHEAGTAATVQAMVFGNMGHRSGTGVAFSRNPSTGERALMGDFLVDAQGEDVVAGTHATMSLTEMADRWPALWDELVELSDRLEHHSADMVDIEFTVEDGKLWLLQWRRAKRSPVAVFRTAIAMAEDPDFPVDRAEAVRRCLPYLDDPPVTRQPAADDADRADNGADGAGPQDEGIEGIEGIVLATGLAASPGLVSGVLSLNPDDALARSETGDRVILIREETSPADVHGIGAAVGLVTTLGGMVSHAAVVARAWGLAAVVGAKGIVLSDGALTSGDRVVIAGEVVTVDGDNGRLLLGDRTSAGDVIPEVETIRRWARTVDDGHPDGGAVPADDTASAAAEAARSAAVSADDCLRVIALKGMGSAESVAGALGADEETVGDILAGLTERGTVLEMPGGRVRPSPEATARAEELWVEEREGLTDAFSSVLDRFHGPNMGLKQVVTAWQVRTVDGTETPNDHDDPAYDQSVLDRLRTEIHPEATPLIAEVAALLPRLGRYGDRLAAALAQLDEGDHRYVAHPLLDSYHTVWFELHEELIRLAGRNRRDETEAGRA